MQNVKRLSKTYKLIDPPSQQEVDVVYTTCRIKRNCHCCGKDLKLGDPFYWDVTNKPYGFNYLVSCGERLIKKYKLQTDLIEPTKVELKHMKEEKQTMTNMISVKEAAKKLKISTSPIYKQIRQGNLKTVKYKRETLIDFAEASKLVIKTNRSEASRKGHQTRKLNVLKVKEPLQDTANPSTSVINNDTSMLFTPEKAYLIGKNLIELKQQIKELREDFIALRWSFNDYLDLKTKK